MPLSANSLLLAEVDAVKAELAYREAYVPLFRAADLVFFLGVKAELAYGEAYVQLMASTRRH